MIHIKIKFQSQINLIMMFQINIIFHSRLTLRKNINLKFGDLLRKISNLFKNGKTITLELGISYIKRKFLVKK
jgi:hypothetical protein